MLNWLAENWYVIAFIFVNALCIVYGIMTGKVKEWLKYAVVVAEKDLGEKTGQLKLRKVYDMFVAQFPKFAIIVPFSVFSKWVDLALEWLKIQLESNAKIKEIINE